MTKYKVLIYLTVIFFTSCNDKKKEPEKSESQIRWDKQEKLDTLNQNEAFSLSKKFNAISNEGSTIKFTYQLQEIVKMNKNPISFIGFIHDITKKDSSYVLNISGTFAEHRCFANILVSPKQFDELYKQLYLNSQLNKGCFIFKPTNIKSSSRLTIDSYAITNDDAETVEEANANASSELTYEFDISLFFKGEMIDFYIDKQLEENEY